MGSLYVPYGVAMPPSPRRVTYVYYEQYLTVVAEGLWGPYGVPCMSPMGSLWDVLYGVAMPPYPRRVPYVYYEQYVTVVAEGLWGLYGLPMGSLWGSLYVPYGMSPMGSQCRRPPAG